MQDRLAQLKGGDSYDGDDNMKDAKVSKWYSISTSTGTDSRNDDGKEEFMAHFYSQAETMQQDILEICKASEVIEELNRRAKIAASCEDNEISSELKSVIEETNLKATKIKKSLEQMKKENAEKSSNPSAIQSETRIRENMYSNLTRKFMDVMREYQSCQQKYKDDIKRKVKRQVQVVKPNATDEEIDMVMRSSDTGSIYKSAILEGTADPVRDALVNCQDKYQDVLRLEASVQELHQMFLDLALLVDEQGEMLDQIEVQVQSAADYVDAGNEQLAKGIKHQSCARKKQCFLLFFGLLVVLALTLGLGVF